MNIRVIAAQAAQQPVPGAAIFLIESEKPNVSDLPTTLANMVSAVFRRKQFTGKEGQTLLIQTWGKTRAEQILLVGLGKLEKLTGPKLSRAAGIAAWSLSNARADRIALEVPLHGLGAGRTTQAFVEGVLMGLYRFDQYQTNEKNEPRTKVKELILCLRDQKAVSDAQHTAGRGRIIAEAVNYTRDVANQPGNVIFPKSLAEQARKLAKEMKLRCTVFDRAALQRKKMGAILAVGAGSVHDPYLITLEYRPAKTTTTKNQKPIALVGKAITFDSGGISIKPSDKMDEMKWDKCGGCAVLGTMRAIAQLKVPYPVVGIIAAAENLPSGTSYRPGDIIKTFSGKTIEVLNTDCEGRVVLADALAWANTFQPRAIVDFATLTGACVVALGHTATGLFGNNEPLIAQLKAAGETSGDHLWPLPLTDEDREKIKGHYADILNTGGREAGASKGAAFLEHFVGKTPWVHLDIAGTAWNTEDKPYLSKGATGVGVRLVAELLGKL